MLRPLTQACPFPTPSKSNTIDFLPSGVLKVFVYHAIGLKIANPIHYVSLKSRVLMFDDSSTQRVQGLRWLYLALVLEFGGSCVR